VRHNATYAVRGNHDHGAAQDVSVIGGVGYKYLTGASRPVARAALAPAERRFLAELPVTRTVYLDHRRILLVHATPRDPLDEIAPPDPELWARRLEGVDADIVCVGHTHQQFALTVNGTMVINPGSVGLPRDGDPRAAYAILEGDQLTLRRVEYPVEEAVRSVEASALPERAKVMLATVYRTGLLTVPARWVNGEAASRAPGAPK
jgi:putative phosphoesterase